MNFPGYYEKFEKMQSFLIGDLKKSTIKGTSNFLVAMGIFNYVEMLGGFHGEKKFEDRFDFVLKKLFPRAYLEVLKQLEQITEKGAYDVLRCGMTHEYLIKTYATRGKHIDISYTVFGVAENDEAAYSTNILAKGCGLEIISLERNKYHVRIYNPRLIYDLNEAFEIFKKYIRSKKVYKDKFLKRCQDIHLEDFT